MGHDEDVKHLCQRIDELIEAGDLAGLREELETNPMCDDFDEARCGLLEYGIGKQDMRMITAALDFGADPAGRESYFVQCALIAKNAAILELILSRGANPNVRWMNEYTPLHCAVESDDVDSAAALLRYGADPNAATEIDDYVTPLMLATREAKFDMIQLLLRHGADPQYKNRLGETAASVAAKRSPGVIEDMLRGDGQKRR